MISAVLDASAVLAFARGEPGSDVVGPRLRGGLMSAVNYSEVLKKTVEHGGSAATTTGLLVRTEVQIIPFDTDHGQIAAELWQASRQLGLSLGDRACLALAIAVSGTVFTADRRMAEAVVPVKIVLVRGGH